MTDVFSSRGGVATQDTGEKARAAVKVFRAMQPTLSAYARALTGKPHVRVEVSAASNGMTDGKRILFRPPLALGDNTPHDRFMCDKRDDNQQQRCPACRIREQVLIVIYHEIGHIAEGSFDKTTDRDRARLMADALAQVNGKYAEAVKLRIERTPEYVKESYMGMAKLVSPFLPGIVNALEDARVNRGVYTARRGTKAMFEADTFRVFSEGVEQKDENGVFVKKEWRDYPLNMQAAVALYCKVSGYDIDKWFVREVVDAMDDDQLREIIVNFPTVRSVAGVYAMAMPVLVRLRELGFFKSETDPQPEPEQEEENDEQESESEPEATDDDPQEGTESDAGGGNDEGRADEGDPSPDGTGVQEGDAGEDGEQEEDSSDGTEGDESSDASPSDGDGSGDSAGSDDDDVQGGDELPPEGADAEASESDSPDDSELGEADPGADQGNLEPGPKGGGVSDDDTDGDEGAVEAEASSEESSEGEVREDRTDTGDDSGDGDAAGTGDDHESNADAPVPGGEDSGVLEESQDGPDSDGDSGVHPTESSVDEDAEGDSSRPEGDDSTEEADVSSSDPLASDDVDDTPIDSGADEGYGGIEVIEDSAFDRLPMGDPEEVEGALHEVAHPEERPDYVQENGEAAREIERAVVQGMYFETPSLHVFGVREHYRDKPIILGRHNMSRGWNHEELTALGFNKGQLGISGDYDIEERILGPALLRMRVAFADNRRGKNLRNQKSGKIDAQVLGKRAWSGDERLFLHRTLPGKKDYFVLIGVDISGSTIGTNIYLAKRAAFAQAELCSRMGIKFAVYAHSGNMHDPSGGRVEGLDLDIYHIKDPDEPWSTEVQNRLLEIGPDSFNLDGHTFEFYRKVCDRRPETHKVILYYTDGKMPAENYAEELDILTREIKICRRNRYVLMGVGIRTDSPVRHGLDTVQVDDDGDIVKVVNHLGKRLLEI